MKDKLFNPFRTPNPFSRRPTRMVRSAAEIRHYMVSHSIVVEPDVKDEQLLAQARAIVNLSGQYVTALGGEINPYAAWLLGAEAW